MRDLESTLRILVGKLTFNQEVITFSTNQRYHTSYVFFLPPKIMRFSTESKLHKTQNHLFFWEMEKSVRPSQEESSFHPPSAQKNHQRELNSLSFASARPPKTIQNTKSATCENVGILPNHANHPQPIATPTHHVMRILWSFAKH